MLTMKNNRVNLQEKKTVGMAYAATRSLLHMLEQMLGADSDKIIHDKLQIESLREKVSFLSDFLEEFTMSISESVKHLEIKISETAYDTEDIIELYVYDQLLPESDGKEKERKSQRFCENLEEAIEKMRLIQEEATEIRDNIVNAVQERNIMPVDISSLNVKDTTMVGFESEFLEMKNWLASSSSKREVISIVGMGGIGKTTLARNVFNDSLIDCVFDIRCWVTVSQEYQKRHILEALVQSTDKLISEKSHSFEELLLQSTNRLLSEKSEEELVVDLYQRLKYRKYLIIMDDLWDTRIWDEVQRSFPDEDEGGRIILTTRLKDVGDHAATRNHVLNLDFLSSDNSWNLLCKTVFGEESCPHHLVDIGLKIAGHCQGLPLSIVVIGGLLSVDKSFGNWETVARSVISLLAEHGSRCPKILYLSYKHLPAHLKPCFLYFAAFREDYDIRKFTLINLWAAEGFLKPLNSYSLEDIAERYLEDLVKRNLIMVSVQGYDGKVKAYKIHDLLRDLCITEVQKTKFLRVFNHIGLPGESRGERRVRLQYPCSIYDYNFLRGPLKTRSFHHHSYGIDKKFDELVKYMSLLRILDINQELLNFPSEVIKLKHLKYLSLRCHLVDVPESISSICGLQTLIVKKVRSAKDQHFIPRTIWKMTRLRYLRIGNCYLPNLPSTRFKGKDFVGLTNLQCLKAIPNFRFTDEIVERLPNLKKLRVCYTVTVVDRDYYHLTNIVRLTKLESLQIVCDFEMDFPETFEFPSSLKKINLSGCQIRWKDLTMVGSLPKLEVLKLGYKACVGELWEPNEGEFRELKFLNLSYLEDLVHWRANDSHFPELKCLEISWCLHLELPKEIGDIATLEMIKLQNVSYSTRTCAELIRETQQDLGNDVPQVHFSKDQRVIRTLPDYRKFKGPLITMRVKAKETN